MIDTETTSTGNHLTNRICEIAILRVAKGKVLDTFSSLVKPDMPITPDATRIHGITNDGVASAPRFDRIAERVYNLIKGTILVCHNTAFDIPLILRELSIAGLNMDKVCSLDTVKLARRAFPGYKSYSLTSIISALGIHREKSHRAYDDCKATAELLWRCLDQLEKMGVADVDGLLTAGRNKQLTKMLVQPFQR